MWFCCVKIPSLKVREEARARLQPVTMLKKSCEGYFQVRVDIDPAGPHKPIKNDIETILASRTT